MQLAPVFVPCLCPSLARSSPFFPGFSMSAYLILPLPLFLSTQLSNRRMRRLSQSPTSPSVHFQPLRRTLSLPQETRVRAGELDHASGRPFSLSISNRYGDNEVTHTLQTESREALQSWREALWQLFFDMSKREKGLGLFFGSVEGKEKVVAEGSLARSSSFCSSSRPVEAVL